MPLKNLFAFTRRGKINLWINNSFHPWSLYIFIFYHVSANRARSIAFALFALFRENGLEVDISWDVAEPGTPRKPNTRLRLRSAVKLDTPRKRSPRCSVSGSPPLGYVSLGARDQQITHATTPIIVKMSYHYEIESGPLELRFVASCVGL